MVIYYDDKPYTPAAFPISSTKPLPVREGDAITWYLRCGHPGKDALEHLVKNATGVKIKGPLIIEYEDYSQAKAIRVVSRRLPSDLSNAFGRRLFFNIFTYQHSYDGYRYALLIKDEFLGYI